jgi:hypothetical protein
MPVAKFFQDFVALNLVIICPLSLPNCSTKSEKGEIEALCNFNLIIIMCNFCAFKWGMRVQKVEF